MGRRVHAEGSSEQHKLELSRAIQTHLEFFKAAYGADEILPKHHYSLHVPGQPPIDCFTMERKLRLLKQTAEVIDNLKTFERSVFARVTLSELSEMTAFHNDALEGRVLPCPELGDAAKVSNALRVRSVRFRVGDVVILERIAAEVLACVELNDDIGVLVELFDFVASPKIVSVSLYVTICVSSLALFIFSLSLSLSSLPLPLYSALSLVSLCILMSRSSVQLPHRPGGDPLARGSSPPCALAPSGQCLAGLARPMVDF